MAKKRKKKRLTLTGLSVANVVGPVRVRNPTMRIRKPGQLIPKSRQP